MQPSTTSEAKPTQGATTWEIDASHSSAAFKVRHMMVTNVRGEFTKLAGTVTFDPAKPEALVAKATIEVASIATRDEKRDAHLRSADFFDVEKYPTISFASTKVRRADKGLEVTGDLTIHGTTREVVLHVDGPSPEHKDPWGNVKIGASAHTKIKRSDFQMTWNAALEAGGVLVGDEITIDIDLELARKQ